MKAIMVMFDSLNRKMLPNYGGSLAIAPAFEELGHRSVTFDNCYAGSLPCMPARRELHTGRYNFLHRSWGPLEPFDESMPELLKKKGIYTHLATDHCHYWEDGGGTYHTRYNSWEISRGQEGDPWKGQVRDPLVRKTLFDAEDPHAVMARLMSGRMKRQDAVNRSYMESEEAMPQSVTFANGLEFLERNHAEDNWFLQIETFDPHEPFFSASHYRDLCPENGYDGLEGDWPPYTPVREKPQEIEHVRRRYAALLSMCDHNLSRVIEAMDRHGLWRDTMLIVNTDHGILLGEHGWWGKTVMPAYDEIVHIPFFLWDPRAGVRGQRRRSLVQTIDIAPTILGAFGVPIPATVEGHDLLHVTRDDAAVRECALFGFHGAQVNVTDGRYVYMRGPFTRENAPLFDYTLMPTHMRSMFSPEELRGLELQEPFAFTKGCRTLKIPARAFPNPFPYGNRLYDLAADPGQTTALDDPASEARMITLLIGLLRKNGAPAEQTERLGLPGEGSVDAAWVVAQRARARTIEQSAPLPTDAEWTAEAREGFLALMQVLPPDTQRALAAGLAAHVTGAGIARITMDLLLDFVRKAVPAALSVQARYVLAQSALRG